MDPDAYAAFWIAYDAARDASPRTLRRAKAYMEELCTRMPSSDAACVLARAREVYDHDESAAQRVFEVGSLAERLEDAATLSPTTRAAVWSARFAAHVRASEAHARGVYATHAQRDAVRAYLRAARAAYDHLGGATEGATRVQRAVLACERAHELAPCEWHTLQLEAAATPWLRAALVHKVASLVERDGRACVPAQVHARAMDVAARYPPSPLPPLRRPPAIFRFLRRVVLRARWTWRRRRTRRARTCSTSPTRSSTT